MSEAIEATHEQCRSAERKATLSSCCGFLGEATLTDSAVIILFAGMLGAGDMFSMLTTSVLPLLNGLCIIPMAWLANRSGGIRSMIMKSCIIASTFYFLAVSAPLWGTFSVTVLIGAIFCFALSLSGFIAGWFPMLDTFLKKDNRTSFLSRMRFSHQLTAVIFLLAVGLIIGKSPPIIALQIVLLIAGIIFTGRAFFISRIPIFKAEVKEEAELKTGIRLAIENKPLTGFSLYLLVLNLAAYGTIPLMTLYMKKSLNAPDNLIIIISSTTLLGMLGGYFMSSKLIKRFRIKGTLLIIHICYILVNMALFFISSGNVFTYIITALLLALYSFMTAVSSIVASAEMMALSPAGNKTMSMAFCGAFYYGGSGLSRFLTSLILGCGILSPQWHIGSMQICHYQSLFLLYAVFVLFAAVFLMIVPAIFPKGEYIYNLN